MRDVLAFDIETIPDVELGRRLHGLEDAPDSDVAEILFSQRRQQSRGGSDFLSHPLHRVIAISMVLRNRDRLRLWSIGEPETPERELLLRFFEGIEQFKPDLVSWNGHGFDLPVLHYRCLRHGVSAPTYWDTGRLHNDFRWNNYRNRYHGRHTDLMDMLAGHQLRASATLEETARLLGLPGKYGLQGDEIWRRYLEGDMDAIRQYCEIDALLTYLIYLRYDLMRGLLSDRRYEEEIKRVRKLLKESDGEHLRRFRENWSAPE
ncbi:MAG: 3'-5' exonuclease [Gammaproteobacteria bacterium]|nr:3'-5' exonuclease [Gammaproteobacteria bacterium]